MLIFNMKWHNSEIKYAAFFNCILLKMKYLSMYDFQILLINSSSKIALIIIILQKFSELAIFKYILANKWMKFLFFQRFLWSKPLLNKESSTVLEAFDGIIKNLKQKPLYVCTDLGKEWVCYFYGKLEIF